MKNSLGRAYSVYLRGRQSMFSSSSSAFPAVSVGFTNFGGRLCGGSNSRCCITQDCEPNTVPIELFCPPPPPPFSPTEKYKVGVQAGVTIIVVFLVVVRPRNMQTVSQGRICCRTEIEVADQTCCLTWSQYTDTRPTSSSRPRDARRQVAKPLEL